MKRNLFLALAISWFLISPAQAEVKLVDTGQPANTTGGMNLIYPQTLLAQFVLNQTATVTSIKGWVNVIQAGNLLVQIYQDNGDVPGAFINAQMAAVASTGAQWVGAASLNWPLKPGTYWVGFFGTMGGFQGTMPGPAPAPLAKEGYIPIPGTDFIRADNMDIGVKINGNPAANSSLLLLLLRS